MIGLFYFRRRPNFGDLLSLSLIKSLTKCESVGYADLNGADILGAGSLLGRVYGCLNGNRERLRNPGDRLLVWGAGFKTPVVSSGKVSGCHDLDVRALRGHLSEEILRQIGYLRDNERPVLGDPGLLYPDLVPEWRNIPKVCEVAVVPHYYDQAAGRRLCGRMKRMGIDAEFVDVSELDPLVVIRRIAGARKILSSSLHGLIVADAMGIPNRRLIFGGHGRREASAISDFKFRDYYSAFGREQPQVFPAEAVMRDPAAFIASFGADDRIPTDEVEERKRALLDSFAGCCDELDRKRQDGVIRAGSAVRIPLRKFRIPLVFLFGNDREFICERLDELVRFSCRSIELICVNCGSNDGTADYVRYYAVNDARIRLSQMVLKVSGIIARGLVCLDWMVVRAILRMFFWASRMRSKLQQREFVE